jgi:hypothetical protein
MITRKYGAVKAWLQRPSTRGCGTVTRAVEGVPTVTRAGRALVVCRGDAFADTAATPFAIMQATLTAVDDRPGIQH